MNKRTTRKNCLQFAKKKNTLRRVQLQPLLCDELLTTPTKTPRSHDLILVLPLKLDSAGYVNVKSINVVKLLLETGEIGGIIMISPLWYVFPLYEETRYTFKHDFFKMSKWYNRIEEQVKPITCCKAYQELNDQLQQAGRCKKFTNNREKDSIAQILLWNSQLLQ